MRGGVDGLTCVGVTVKSSSVCAGTIVIPVVGSYPHRDSCDVARIAQGCLLNCIKMLFIHLDVEYEKYCVSFGINFNAKRNNKNITVISNLFLNNDRDENSMTKIRSLVFCYI